MKNIHIINSKGDKELFFFQKVYQSAVRAGADKNLAREIAGIIQKDFPKNSKYL